MQSAMSHSGRQYASHEKVKPAPLQQGREQNRRERHAQKKEPNLAFGQGRQGWEGEESEAGDCYRDLRSAQKRSEGSAEEVEFESRLGVLVGLHLLDTNVAVAGLELKWNSTTIQLCAHGML